MPADTRPGIAAGVAPAQDARPNRAERIVRTCPNCGRELQQRSCKLFCPEPGCGFFLSCADYV